VATPTFEHLELFTIKSGDAIIEEIYSFKDKGGRDLALRPELTAPVMRMYVNELQGAPKPLRLYYFGSCFRYERPQHGRFREFWQLGCELIGGRSPDAEAETIALAHDLLRSVNISGEVHLGHLGAVRRVLKRIPKAVRPVITGLIDKKERDHLKEYLEEIGADHLGLIDLISLKGKGAVDEARDLLEEIEEIPEYVEEEGESTSSGKDLSYRREDLPGGRAARRERVQSQDMVEGELDKFAELIDLLEYYGVSAKVDFEIVRGLDYYTGCVFEIYGEGLGAQNQICGGGAYRLAGLLGGKEIESTGFALGFDRIMEIANVAELRRAPVVLAFTPQAKGEAIRAAGILRRKIPIVIDVMSRGLAAQLKYANIAGARHVVIIGEKEAVAGKLMLKDMEKGEQECLTLDEMVVRLDEMYPEQ
jgi:histidyl-tRNA synthetase